MVKQEIASGRFRSPEECIAAAVELLHERDAGRDGSVEKLNAKLDEAIAEAARGELMPLDEFRDELRKMKAEWVPSRKTA